MDRDRSGTGRMGNWKGDSEPLGLPSDEETTLKARAYRQLKELILSDALSPGTFLSERQFAAKLGMSKTPVRLAIERLASEGFLIVSPQQGIVVAEPSLEEVLDLFELRRVLEGYTARRLAGRLTAPQVQRLEENLAAQDVCARTGDVLSYRKLDTEFHLMLAEYLGNREVRRIMEQAGDRLMRIIFRIVKRQPERMASSTEEHRSILAAIVEGDAELAERRMTQHLEWGQRFLMSWGL